MIVILFTYPVVKGLEQEFEAAFARRPKLVDQHEGFVSFEVLRPTEKNGRYVLMSKWSSMEAYETYLTSREHEQVHRNDHSRFLAGPPEKQIYEVTG